MFHQNIRVVFLLLFVLLTVKTYAGSPMKHLEKIAINGVNQWIYVTGKKKDNPVLLVLHGGPGFAMLPLFHEKIPDLEQDFTVVNWDQRGAGKSYSKNISCKTMRLDQLVKDAHDLTQILKKRFNTKKIYLLGHSSGTMLGVRLAKKYPEDYIAYIGVGQVVDFAENERGSYDFALASAIKSQNKLAENELQKIGKPNDAGNYKQDEGYDVTSKWVEYFGGSLYHSNNLENIYNLIFDSKIYENDSQKILKGYQFSQKLFDDENMRNFDLLKESSSLPMPVYLLSGKHDYETPTPLIKKYFDDLKIDNKKFIEFSNSAHFPFYEEPEKFVSVMKQIKSQV